METVDLPSSQSSTEGFLSLLDDDLNPLLLGFKRLSFQLNLAQEFFSDLLQKGVSSLVKPTRTEELLRDEFNTHKVIVALTSFSKVSCTLHKILQSVGHYNCVCEFICIILTGLRY